MRSRSALPAWGFIFPSWMRTFIFRVFWRDFWGRGDGWRRGWGALAASRGARPSEPLPKRTGGWVGDRRRRREGETVIATSAASLPIVVGERDGRPSSSNAWAQRQLEFGNLISVRRPRFCEDYNSPHEQRTRRERHERHGISDSD